MFFHFITKIKTGKISGLKILFFTIILQIPVILSGQNLNSTKDCLCITKHQTKTIYNYPDIEKKPVFPGGEAELLKYVATNIVYPSNQEDLQTRVFVKFCIDKQGKVSKACVIRPLNKNILTALEKEILRVILEMPDWIPAERKNKKVAMWFVLPIRLELR